MSTQDPHEHAPYFHELPEIRHQAGEGWFSAEPEPRLLGYLVARGYLCYELQQEVAAPHTDLDRVVELKEKITHTSKLYQLAKDELGITAIPPLPPEEH